MIYKIVDEKGRVTIPQEIRDRLGLKPNTIVSLKECGGCLAIHPEKVCDNCRDETPGGKVLDAFDLLSPTEKEAVIHHISKHHKGCESG